MRQIETVREEGRIKSERKNQSEMVRTYMYYNIKLDNEIERYKGIRVCIVG